MRALYSMLWRILLVPMLSNEILWIGSHWRKRPDAKKKISGMLKKTRYCRIAATCIQIRESIALHYIIWLYTHMHIYNLHIFTHVTSLSVSWIPILRLNSCIIGCQEQLEPLLPAAANAGGIEGGCGGLDLHASQGEIGESKNRMGENMPTNNTLDGFRISVSSKLWRISLLNHEKYWIKVLWGHSHSSHSLG